MIKDLECLENVSNANLDTEKDRRKLRICLKKEQVSLFAFLSDLENGLSEQFDDGRYELKWKLENQYSELEYIKEFPDEYGDETEQALAQINKGIINLECRLEKINKLIKEFESYLANDDVYIKLSGGLGVDENSCVHYDVLEIGNNEIGWQVPDFLIMGTLKGSLNTSNTYIKKQDKRKILTSKSLADSAKEVIARNTERVRRHTAEIKGEDTLRRYLWVLFSYIAENDKRFKTSTGKPVVSEVYKKVIKVSPVFEGVDGGSESNFRNLINESEIISNDPTLKE